MALDQTLSGLDVTVKLDCTPRELAIKRRRHDPPLEEIYPLDIQFYTRKPCSILAEKMKILVKERILALKEIHSIMKNSGHGEFNEKRENVATELRIKQLDRYANFLNSPGHRTCSIEDVENRIIDHASFVALRLALVFDSEGRALHQKIEEELFHLRVSALDNEGIRELLAFNKIEYEKISDQERIELKDELAAMLSDSADYDNTEFFKIPILKLLGFIKVYDIYIKDGIAYVPLNCMPAVLRSHYHNYLNLEVAVVNKTNLEKACRIQDGVEKFNDFFTFCCREFETMEQKIMQESNISLAMIDTLAVTAFPPCMRTIHEHLRTYHHLKHQSRLQYTLFLKAIGLSVEDTVSLFRDEFLKTVSAERFEKEYTYYIFHAYGMKGRKCNTPPKDCSSIIDTITPIGDCNGCVFAHDGIPDMEDLSEKLSRWNIPEHFMEKIVEYTEHGQCGHACATYFEAINRHPSTGPIVHPNHFFNESRRLAEFGSIFDSSEESSAEEGDIDVSPYTLDSNEEGDIDVSLDTLDSGDEVIPQNFNGLFNDLINLVIEWEGQICPGSLRSGTMVKLKHEQQYKFS